MKRKVVVLVEDDPDEAELARVAFASVAVPHRLIVLDDGADAIAFLERALAGDEERPDLVLLDLKLPGIGGLDVLQHVRRHPRALGLPIVIVTSSVEQRDVRESYERGATSYVRKPTAFDEFRELIAVITTYFLTMHEGDVGR